MKVLIVTGGYLPGYKHGGPIRSIHGLVELLGDELDFSIVTAGHDLGETKPYDGVPLNTWTPVGKADVYYSMGQKRSPGFWRRILADRDPDVIYFNSFFSADTRSFLLWRRLGILPDIPIVLAPRGEFSAGALRLKSRKKQLFLTLSSRLGLHRGLLWHATAAPEMEDIRRTIGSDAEVSLAAPGVVSPRDQDKPGLTKMPGKVRFVFISRVVPKKNLLGAISAIGRGSNGATLDIFGPIEDEAYWNTCQAEINRHGLSDVVSYRGELPHADVPDALSQHHFFLFPTFGENFGHVIAEALNQGLPAIVSDQTPWLDLESAGVGWDISLHNDNRWNEVIDQCIAMDNDEYQSMSARSRAYVDRWIEEQGGAQANLELFQRAEHLYKRRS